MDPFYFDEKPVSSSRIRKAIKNGEVETFSEDAWMCLMTLCPRGGADLRPTQFIYNKGATKNTFAGFFNEYKDIWENRSIPAELKSKSPDVGWIEGFTLDCIELNKKLAKLHIISDHDKDIFKKWSSDVLEYLQNHNKHQEKLEWLKNVIIDDIQTASYEDICTAYDAGCKILLELHKELSN